MAKIKVETSLVLIYSTLMAVWHRELDINHISIPLAVPTILGTIISLLLAFRSNQAYDRWWEARIIWGSIVNDSRSLMRQMQSFISDPDYSVNVNRFIERFGNRQIAWAYSLGRTLRGQQAFEEKELWLTAEERIWAGKHSNVPNALLSLHARDIRTAFQSEWINPYQQVELDRTVTRLCDSMGKCERIKNTVFPTTYSLYIHFALYLFIVLLPFGLTASMGFVQVPLMVAISSAFLLIEKMAIYLQDPFENKPTDTPVTAIAQTIERDLRQMMNDDTRTPQAEKQRSSEREMEQVYYVL
ncbi:bestrophin family protein [Chryseolinea lacunae]|nr:bestrophin family ion channel [Chryseolinea lacunae]